MAYRIDYDRQAATDVRALPPRYRAPVAREIESRLAHTPTKEDRHRKPLRPNATASWELAVYPYRVLYDVDESGGAVRVRRVLHKPREQYLDEQGREVDLDDPDR
jgi:mRNA-degrading endonuclease RelE of RelBE toxin-antitoxin system